MRASLLIPALTLGACSLTASDVRDTKIADVNFSDAAAIQRIEQALTPTERKHFDGYVMSRVALPGMEVVRKDGTPPYTVREAIELTQRRADLMTRRNALVYQMNKMLEGGLSDASRPEWERIGKQVEEYERLIAETKVK